VFLYFGEGKIMNSIVMLNFINLYLTLLNKKNWVWLL